MSEPAQRLRILIAHSFYRNPGGEDRYVRTQMDLLGSRHEVELIGPQNSDLRSGPGVALEMLRSPKKERMLTNVIQRFQPDVIHLHNAYPALGSAVHLAAVRNQVPLVMTVHNFRLRCPNGFMFTEGSICRRCEKGAYQNAVVHRCFPSKTQAVAYASVLWSHRFAMKLEKEIDYFFTPSDFMRRRMLEWGFPSSKVGAIGHAMPMPEKVNRAFEGHGVYVGRLSSEKGLFVLLAALKYAGDPPFKIVGDGPLRNDLQKAAADLGLKNVAFTGRVPTEQVAPVLMEARFLAMPSSSDENYPLAALEAMSLGRALLVTRNGGLPELVASGEGLACDADDVEGMAHAIRRLTSDDELCRNAGHRARAFAESRLSPSAHRTALEKVYRLVIDAARAASG